MNMSIGELQEGVLKQLSPAVDLQEGEILRLTLEFDVNFLMRVEPDTWTKFCAWLKEEIEARNLIWETSRGVFGEQVLTLRKDTVAIRYIKKFFGERKNVDTQEALATK